MEEFVVLLRAEKWREVCLRIGQAAGTEALPGLLAVLNRELARERALEALSAACEAVERADSTLGDALARGTGVEEARAAHVAACAAAETARVEFARQ